MKKPLGTHDVRQSAYRDKGPQSEDTGIPDGKERADASAADLPPPDHRTDSEGNEHTSRNQPNQGQAGTYGAEGQETSVTAENHNKK
jgi:hypothetical protein